MPTRWDDYEQCVVALNNRDITRTLDLPLAGVPIPDGAEMRDLLSGDVYRVRAGRVEGVRIRKRDGALLHRET